MLLGTLLTCTPLAKERTVSSPSQLSSAALQRDLAGSHRFKVHVKISGKSASRTHSGNLRHFRHRSASHCTHLNFSCRVCSRMDGMSDNGIIISIFQHSPFAIRHSPLAIRLSPFAAWATTSTLVRRCRGAITRCRGAIRRCRGAIRRMGHHQVVPGAESHDACLTLTGATVAPAARLDAAFAMRASCLALKRASSRVSFSTYQTGVSDVRM